MKNIDVIVSQIGNNFTITEYIFDTKIEGNNYEQCLDKFCLIVQAKINEYREKNNGITPEMALMLHEIEQIRNTESWLDEKGFWHIKKDGQWIIVDSKGFSSD